mgnify:FL=1
MEYNSAKLRGKIAEVYKTQARFAEAVGVSERSISLKMSGKVAWRSDEIVKAAQLLSIEPQNIADYFLPAVFKDLNN